MVCTMKSFFTMCWNPNDARSAAHAEQIRQCIDLNLVNSPAVLTGPGILFLNLSDDPAAKDVIEIRDERNELCGIVFGNLFERNDDTIRSAPLFELKQDEGARLCRSCGGVLFERYWGSYAGIGKSHEKLWAVADPLASIPCYYLIEHGVFLIFSHLERCLFLETSRLTLNRDFIALLLHYDKVQTGETGFHEIRELRGGERLLTDGLLLTTDFLWDPRHFAARPVKLPLTDAAQLLADTTTASIASWSELFDRVRLNLSGGLDSTIVASCLAQCRHQERLELVHQVMESSDQSEAEFAKATAMHLGLNLTVELQSAQTGLPALNAHPPSTRPYRQFLASTQILPSVSAERVPVFTGQGGDHLFFVARLSSVFADHIRLNGLSGGTIDQLFEAARLSGKSIWAVMREAAVMAASRQPASPLARAILDRQTSLNSSLTLSSDILSKLPVWTIKPEGLPPAKFQQLNLLAHLVHMRRPLPSQSDHEVVHPLISQPLLELCLRIPSYQLTAQGINRGLARLAFKDRIPDSVRLRTTKGSASRYYRSRTIGHRDEISAALLDGELVARGILDRDAVAAFFAQREDERHSYGHMALVYYTVEAWARRWHSAR